MKLYLIGSLRNPQIPLLGNLLREIGYDVIDTWWAASDDADEWWQKYEQIRGRPYWVALYSHYATHIWEYDKGHLDTADLGVLFHPVGRSSHIEAGYLIGQGKPVYVYFDKEPERWDVMYRFATDVFTDLKELLHTLKEVYNGKSNDRTDSDSNSRLGC